MDTRHRHHRTERGGRLSARAFGSSVTHLDVELASGGRAAAVTSVLAACLTEGDGASLDSCTLMKWTLAQRLQALIAVRRAGGQPQVVADVRCPACGTIMELDIDLPTFVVPPAPATVAWRSGEDQDVIVRLPSGADQERWIAHAITDTAAIAGSLVVTIEGVEPPEPFHAPTSWLDDLSEVLEAHDPLTTLTLSATCPECAATCEHPVDLEALLLRELAREQTQIIEQVHRLATELHWSERDIIALPAWRRSRYLELSDAARRL